MRSALVLVLACGSASSSAREPVAASELSPIDAGVSVVMMDASVVVEGDEGDATDGSRPFPACRPGDPSCAPPAPPPPPGRILKTMKTGRGLLLTVLYGSSSGVTPDWRAELISETGAVVKGYTLKIQRVSERITDVTVEPDMPSDKLRKLRVRFRPR